MVGCPSARDREGTRMQAPIPETTQRLDPRGRTIAFRILAAFFGFVTLAFSVPFMFASLTDEEQKIHAFHNIGDGLAFSIVVGVTLLLAAWKPAQMLAAFQIAFVASFVLALPALVAGDLISGSYFVGTLVVVVLAILHPARHELWTLGRIRPSLPVLWMVWLVPAIS